MRRIDDLDLNNLKIIQDDRFFSFGIDAVILSDFFGKNRKFNRVLDIGTGNGILPLLLIGKKKCDYITGIEIQEELAELASENVRFNNLDSFIDIINMSVKDYKEDRLFDAIITNPPYMKKESGKHSYNINKAIARTELCLDMEDLFSSCKRLLKENGTMYMINRAIRIVDIFENARKCNIEPKKMRFVKTRLGENPNLVLIEFVKGAKPFLTIEQDLIIYDNNGDYSEEIYKIYNMEKK